MAAVYRWLLSYSVPPAECVINPRASRDIPVTHMRMRDRPVGITHEYVIRKTYLRCWTRYCFTIGSWPFTGGWRVWTTVHSQTVIHIYINTLTLTHNAAAHYNLYYTIQPKGVRVAEAMHLHTTHIG